MTDLEVTDYSEKAIVVRGDTKMYKEQLKTLGGKYNANLRDGPGWIFPKKFEDKVLAFTATGVSDVPESSSEEKTVSSPVVNISAENILVQLDKLFIEMPPVARLTFLSKIHALSAKPYSGGAGLSVPKLPIRTLQALPKSVQVTTASYSSVARPMAKPMVSKIAFAKSASAVSSDPENPEEDGEEDAPVARPRLLGK